MIPFSYFVTMGVVNKVENFICDMLNICMIYLFFFLRLCGGG